MITRLLRAAACFAAFGCAPIPPNELPATVEQMAVGYESEWPDVPQVTAREYDATPADQRPILIDAREPKERHVSIIPGAITPEELPDQVERPVLIYCTIGYRSTKLADELRGQGVSAANLHGGVLAWAHHGGGFVTPDGESTRTVHVYDEPWDLLPEGYTSDY